MQYIVSCVCFLFNAKFICLFPAVAGLVCLSVPINSILDVHKVRRWCIYTGDTFSLPLRLSFT